jgi:hypothetical protein
MTDCPALAMVISRTFHLSQRLNPKQTPALRLPTQNPA